MRPLLLSVVTCVLVLGAVWAQNTGESGGAPQLPVGQTFKQFEFPIYQQGVLKATLDAVEAKGITLNRAETTDLTIKIYDNGAVTTTYVSIFLGTLAAAIFLARRILPRTSAAVPIPRLASATACILGLVMLIQRVAAAGADTFVAGSAIFGCADYQAVIDAMRYELRGAKPVSKVA